MYVVVSTFFNINFDLEAGYKENLLHKVVVSFILTLKKILFLETKNIINNGGSLRSALT